MSRFWTYGCLFFLCLALQGSLIFSLPKPLAFIPLMFIVGVLITHRSESVYGAVWFLLSAVLLPLFGAGPGTFISYIAVAIVSLLVTDRLFANRSVYALIGLGGTLFLAYAFSRFLFFATINVYLYGLLFTVIGLYFGYVASRYIERLESQLFLIRS